MKIKILIGLLVMVVFISGCFEEKECEVKEDCPDKTCFSKECIDNNCSYSQIIPCCGNEKCEIGEDYESCADDCPNCDDKDKCTEDSFNYQKHECLNKKVIPCCGNEKCEVSETYKECTDDCEKTGYFEESEVWAGEILITGDVHINNDLRILPGTVVKFAVKDDQQEGYETPADGYNDLDPTRLISYGKTHSSLTVRGKLIAAGTPKNNILFTSAAENPKIADWEAIQPQSDGSLIAYSIIEWSRNGISPGNEPSPNSIFRNNIIRYAMWGSISTGWSGCQVYNNEIYECGHEAVDVQGGDPIIENNTIYDCHVGIVVLRGSAIVRNNVMRNVGNDIHIGGDATPILESNSVRLASRNSKKEWCYEDFCYAMFGDPVSTPILTEVYKENNLPRYAVPAYRIKYRNYYVDLPLKAEEWLAYGWENDKWNKINIGITTNQCKFPSGYSMYVLIPNPTEEEKDAEIFNDKHYDIYKIMAV